MTMNQSFTEQVNTPNALPADEMVRVQQMYEDILLQTDTTRLAGRIARTYAEALLSVAERKGQADAVAEQFDSLLADVFRTTPGLERFLDSPASGRKKKDEVLARVFDGRSVPLFLDFLRLLNRKDRLGLLRLIAVAYRTLREQKANRMRVLVETAAPLADDQKAALRDTLARTLGKTPVLVVREVPELIGGLIVHAGDRVLDTSVRSRLTALRNQLMARGSHEIQSGRDRFGSD